MCERILSVESFLYNLHKLSICSKTLSEKGKDDIYGT